MVNIRNELCISCCWTLSEWSHGVSGHIFEIIDYFHVLKHKTDVHILLCDPTMTIKWFTKIISEKYDFNQEEIEQIINSTTFVDRPKYIKCNKILFVDGCLIKMEQHGIKIFAEQIYTFMCSKYEKIHSLKTYQNVIPLLDYRVYTNSNPEDVKIGIDYTKKLLLSRYKTMKKDSSSTALVYATKNCRQLTSDQLVDITNHYDFNHYLLITDDDNLTTDDSNITVLDPPVENLFDMFGTFIYTPTLMKWDGSPRFPVECKHYGKDVIYHRVDDSYLRHDRGLFFRMQDINTNYDRLHLETNDSILDVI